MRKKELVIRHNQQQTINNQGQRTKDKEPTTKNQTKAVLRLFVSF